MAGDNLALVFGYIIAHISQYLSPSLSRSPLPPMSFKRTSRIPLAGVSRRMHRGRSINHQIGPPSACLISIHDTASSVPRILIQRRHQGGGTLRSRSIPHGHIGRRSCRMERVVGRGRRRRRFFLGRMSG